MSIAYRISQIVLVTTGIWSGFLLHWILPSIPEKEIFFLGFATWAFGSPFVFAVLLSMERENIIENQKKFIMSVVEPELSPTVGVIDEFTENNKKWYVVRSWERNLDFVVWAETQCSQTPDMCRFEANELNEVASPFVRYAIREDLYILFELKFGG